MRGLYPTLSLHLDWGICFGPRNSGDGAAEDAHLLVLLVPPRICWRLTGDFESL